MHAEYFPGQYPPHQYAPSLLHGMAMPMYLQGRVCITQSSGVQVDVRHLCEGLVVSSGISHH